MRFVSLCLMGLFVAALSVGCGKSNDKAGTAQKGKAEGAGGEAAKARTLMAEVLDKRDVIRQGWLDIVRAEAELDSALAKGNEYIEAKRAELEEMGKELLPLKDGAQTEQGIFKMTMMERERDAEWSDKLNALKDQFGGTMRLGSQEHEIRKAFKTHLK